MRIGNVVAVLVIVTSMSFAHGAAPTSGDVVLAEKFCEIAQGTLRVKQLTRSTWDESGALLQAAMRLNPNEPRYPSLLSNLMLEKKDIDGALSALAAFRKLRPADVVPQIQ